MTRLSEKRDVQDALVMKVTPDGVVVLLPYELDADSPQVHQLVANHILHQVAGQAQQIGPKGQGAGARQGLAGPDGRLPARLAGAGTPPGRVGVALNRNRVYGEGLMWNTKALFSL